MSYSTVIAAAPTAVRPRWSTWGGGALLAGSLALLVATIVEYFVWQTTTLATGVVSAIVVTVFGIVAVTYHVTADYGPAYPYVVPQWSPDGIAGIVTFVGGGAFGVIQFVLARYTFVGWFTIGSMAFATVTWFWGTRSPRAARSRPIASIGLTWP